jgi:long-chain fatty acid transport protein
MRAKVWLAGWIFGVIASLLMSAQCFAAGFALWEGSARGNALGDAVVGRADDPSAVFYNPAGITQLPGLQVEAGATGIMTGGTVSSPGGTVNSPLGPVPDPSLRGSQVVNSDWALVPNMYLTYQASDRIWLGLGVFSPYGLSVRFPTNWFGAYNSYYSEVQSVDVNPNIAFKINDQLSVAAGFQAMEFGMDLQQRGFVYPASLVLPVSYFPTTQIKGDTWGYGYNLAVHYKPCQWVAMGVSYRSKVTEGGDMNAYLRQRSALIPSGNLYSATHASIDLPDSVDMGVVFYPSDSWSWEFGGTWTRWSDLNALVFTFDRPIYGVNPAVQTKDWNDSWRFKTGIEYHLTPHVDLRTGYIFDQEVIPDSHADYVLPSANRHYFCFGGGLHYGNVSFDLSYTYVLIEDRTVTNSQSLGYINPTHQTGENANLIAGDITYRFW